MTSPNTEGLTVGVSLPVPEPWGAQLQQARTSYGEARAAHIPTHVTLLPPTAAAASDLEALVEHVDRVAREHPPFPIVLRGTGTFRPVSLVVYLALAVGVSSCEQLQSAVRNGPVSRRLEFPYHPHVTVAHDLEPQVLDRAFEELAGFSASFVADRIACYAHEGDGQWREVTSHTLRG